MTERNKNNFHQNFHHKFLTLDISVLKVHLSMEEIEIWSKITSTGAESSEGPSIPSSEFTVSNSTGKLLV